MSQEVWNKNFKALQSRWPEIAACIEKADTDTDLEVGVQDVCDKKVLYVVQNGEVKQLDSLYDSEQLIELWLSKFPNPWTLNSKLLMFGIGNGMFIRAFLQNLSEDHTAIIYEPSVDILKKAMEEFDMSDIFESTRVTVLHKCAMTKEIQEYYYELLTFTDMGTFQYHSYLNYNSIYAEEYIEYMKALQNTCNGINSSQGVYGRLGRIYNTNTLRNIPYFIKGKALDSLYRNLPKEIPAIIVSAGPSLDKNIKQLHKAKGKSLLIAVESALKPMLKEGIIPDLCVSVDGNKSRQHFTDEISKTIPLVCMISSISSVLAEHTGDLFFLNDMNHYIQHFMSANDMILPVTSTGGSVANDAFSVARMLGAKTIILVGQDLAYTGNKTHSATSVRGEWGVDATSLNNSIWTEGIDGKPILSSGEFQLYRIWFEEQIKRLPEIKVIDATEGGAKIQGSIVQTLEKTIQEECTKEADVDEALKKTRDFFDKDMKEAFIEYINRLPRELQSCQQTAKEGCRCYERLLKLVYNNKYHSQEVKKLSTLSGEVTQKLETAPCMEFVKNEIQNETTEMLKTVYQTEQDERSELIAVCNSGIDYLKLIIQAIDKLMPVVEKSTQFIGEHTYSTNAGSRIVILKGQSAGNVLRLAADQLCVGFKNLDINCLMIDLGENITSNEELQKIVGELSSEDNRAVISMQALLFELKYNGKSLMDCIKCPVYGWIFDHPICHGQRLELPKSERVHVMCVDQKHVLMVEQYYPNIKHVHFMPHRGFLTNVMNIPWQYRKIEVLFAGRYVDYMETLNSVEKINQTPSYKAIQDNLMKRMLDYPEDTYEESVRYCVKHSDLDSDENSVVWLEIMYHVYRASYEKFRQDMIAALLERGQKVTVCGRGWEKFQTPHRDLLTVLDDREYMIEDVVELMKNSKVVLNTVPVFRAGAHERIFTAMLSGAVCATDENEYLHEIFSQDEILFYSVKEPDKLAEKIQYILSHTEEAESMTVKAFVKAMKGYTWGKSAEDILALLND